MSNIKQWEYKYIEGGSENGFNKEATMVIVSSSEMIEVMKVVFAEAKCKHKMAYVEVSLPGQPRPEIIVNYPESLDNKLAYYNNAYNDDGTLKSNPAIRIVKFGIINEWIEVVR